MQPDATSRISASATHGNRKNAAAPLQRGKDADRKRKKTKTVSQKLLEKVCRHNFFSFCSSPVSPPHLHTLSPPVFKNRKPPFSLSGKTSRHDLKKDFFPKNLLRVQASPTGSATSENEFLKVGKSLQVSIKITNIAPKIPYSRCPTYSRNLRPALVQR